MSGGRKQKAADDEIPLVVFSDDKRYWKELIRWLPSSWLQTRTWTSNYETIRNMYHQRKNHKLTEWKDDFCSWVETLPYAAEFLTDENIISFD